MLLEHGCDAVRIAGSGELPPGGHGPVEAIDEDKLGALGRATRTITALDRGPRPKHGPDGYVTAVSQVMAGWVLSLLAVTLLLPALVAAVDAFARARRQHVDVLPWLRWVAAWVAPFLAGLATAELLALVGATPPPPPAPVAPDVLPLDGAALGVLAGVGDAMALAAAGALSGRPAGCRAEPARAARRRGRARAGGDRGGAGALARQPLRRPAGGAGRPPLAARAAGRRAARAGAVRGALIALGALPALLVAIYYMAALSMDPLSAAWYLLLLVTGHSVGLPTALVGCVMLGALCASIELVYRTPVEVPECPRRRDHPARPRPRPPQVVQQSTVPLGAGSAGVDTHTDGQDGGTFPMMSTMSKDALARAIERGEYVVDTRAVAEAMLRQGAVLVLVPAQPLDRPAVRVQQDDAAPEAGVA